MTGDEEKRGEGGLGEPLPPPHEPPQQLSQGIAEELPQDRPQLSLPHHEDKQEADEEEESQHAEGQFDGVLDEDTVAEGLHKLGLSAPGIEYVYLNLSLSGRELSDISILSRYIHLQKLELSYNKINDLSCISHMPHLLELNASNNELTTYFLFKPPINLKEVDFSYNQIPKMRDLSAYQSLTKLLLDFNNIEEIRGLEKCHSLTHLSLSHNRLIAIAGLENLPIKILNLSFNQIEKISGLDSLKTLQKLDLSSNKITSLEGLEEHDLLEMISLEDNQLPGTLTEKTINSRIILTSKTDLRVKKKSKKIAELRELDYIEDLPLLRVLNLLKNPVQEQTDYWLFVIFKLLQLTELDLKKISVEEKVATVNKYDPPPEVVAAEDHMAQVMYSVLQPHRIFDSTLPSLDTPYPMLVLVGPLACGKRELTHKICRQFNNFFRYGPCHTTRAAYFGEDNRLDYYFISQEAFDKMVNTGKFIATYKYSGYYYGLGRDTVESIAREGLATCVHLEIEGVRSLKNTYFKPRYILLVPTNKEVYEGHLRRKGLFSRSEIEEAVSRVDMYNKTSQDFPGYFDAVINTDELDEAFTELSFLVKAYLGLEPPVVSDSVQDLNSRAAAGSRIRLLEKQRLSPGRVITGTTWSSFVNEFLDSSAKNNPGGISDRFAAQLSPVGAEYHLSALQQDAELSHSEEIDAVNRTMKVTYERHPVAMEKHIQHTLVEEASLRRRHSAARRALSEKAPGAYVQLFQRDLAVTPAPSSSRHQLLEPTINISLLSDGRNITQDQSFPLPSPESRCRESGPASGRFITSAGASAAGVSVQTPVPRARITEEAKAEHRDPRRAENRVDRQKEVELPSDDLQRRHSKSKTESSLVPPLINRPGSHSRPVLPPIPSGRMTTNP